MDLSEVERATSSLQDVDKATVLCYHPGQEDQAILAFVTLKNGHLVTEMKLENALADKLPAYMLPQVIIIETVPLLVNGKIDRQTLLKSYENTNNNGNFFLCSIASFLSHFFCSCSSHHSLPFVPQIFAFSP